MEEEQVIGKRVDLTTKNIKRIKIISALLEGEQSKLKEKQKIDYIINKALESYYESDEIKELLSL